MQIRQIILFTLIIYLYACAQVVSPTGGPRDTAAPIVLNTEPPSGSTNFKAKEIIIEFDEYIQLANLNEELTVSPPTKNKVDVLLKGKQLVVKIEDSLLPNTTYSINFGNAIKDNHEGNILEGYKYAFSTGSQIDTLSASGLVLDAFTLDPEEKYTVMLYANPYDSIVYKDLPRYISRTAKNGEFKFENIKEGNYLLFALNDKNRNTLFDLPNENIAFQNNLVTINGDTSNLKLYSFLEDNSKQYLKVGNYKNGKLVLVFNKATEDVSLRPIDANFSYEWYKKERNKAGDTIQFYFLIPDSTTFSSEILLDGKITDSLKLTVNVDKDIDSIVRIENKIPFGKYNINKPISLHFSAPIDSVQKDKIIILKDSLVQDFDIQFIDTLQKILKIDIKLKEESNYQLLILPRAITDIYNRTTDTISSKFITTAYTDYGNLEVQLSNLDSNNTSNFILQLLSKDKKVIQEKIIKNKESVQFKNLEPNTYRLKVIFDENKNGKWDVGDFWKKINAERVALYIEEINIRANWDKKIDWQLK